MYLKIFFYRCDNALWYSKNLKEQKKIDKNLEKEDQGLLLLLVVLHATIFLKFEYIIEKPLWMYKTFKFEIFMQTGVS